MPLVMNEDNAMMLTEEEPNVHIHHTGMTFSMSGKHSSPVSTETMTDDHPEHRHRPRPVMTQKPEAVGIWNLLTSVVMRFLPVAGLVASLILTSKASDGP